LDSIPKRLSRSGDAESVVRQVVGQDKCGHQYAFETLALPINLLEIVASAQIRRHELQHI
jgi:hypothetical protein